MSIIIKIHIFQDAKGKRLIRNNTRGYATAERGALFHPTVGLATPKGFTTSHPRAETTMLLRLRLSVYQWPGAKVTILPLYYHSLCVLPEFSPRIPPTIASTPRLILLRGCVWCDYPRVWSGLTALRMGGSPSHPSLSRPPTSLRDINFWGPASRFWFFGPVESKYGVNSRWKLTPPF